MAETTPDPRRNPAGHLRVPGTPAGRRARSLSPGAGPGRAPGRVPLFGRMIREARIHFAAVIEEARIAGLDTGAIAAMLGKLNIELADSIRPELWARVEQLLAERATHPGGAPGER